MLVTLILYFMALFFMSGMMEIVFLIFLMELLSWMFIIMIKKELVLKYLVIQSAFLLMAVLSMMWLPNMFLIVILFKLGLPPFHLWMVNISLFLKKSVFIFMSTFHKMAPLFLLSKLSNMNITYLMSSVVLMALLMVESSSLFLIMMISSMTHSGWIILSSMASFKLMFVYFMVYTMVTSSFFFSLSMDILNQSSFEQSSSTNLMWMILSGLPPFSLFWLKVAAMSCMVSLVAIGVVMLSVSVVSLFTYYRVFNFSLVSGLYFNPSMLTTIPLVGCFGIL